MKKAKLKVASCQFPVTGDIERNAKYVRQFMRRAVKEGADLLHTSETCLSGYAGTDFGSFEGFDWEMLRKKTGEIRELARELGIWVVLGSSHFLGEKMMPANCLYLIDPKGKIVDQYDKCMCTMGDQKFYQCGQRLVTRTINGVKIGLAICYDVGYPQIYAAYRKAGATVMLHSFYNARHKGKSCLNELNIYQVPTRCADNQMWAVANNSTGWYSNWGGFVARPDATILKRLPMNRAGMLVHEFPDGLSEGGWLHNFLPLKLDGKEAMWFGKPTRHARQVNGRAEP